MKTLNTNEVQAVSGGFTDLECVMGSGILGTAAGVLIGAEMGGHGAAHPVGAVAGMMAGAFCGGGIGFAAGVVAASIYVGYEWATYDANKGQT